MVLTDNLTDFGETPMKRPKPWYWKARKAWYLEHDGKQVKLGSADSKTKNPPEEIMREYHRIMAGEGLLTERERRLATAPVVIESFIEGKVATRPKTVKMCVYYLEPFAAHFKSRLLDTIRPNDVLKFVDSHKGWGDSTKHSAVVYVKGLFRWARDSGWLDANPLAGFANPYPVGRRDRGITLEEFKMLMDATRDETFRSVLRFLRDTGCRPGELCCLSKRHLHPTLPIATLKPSEHKTGRRTGRNKEIILTRPIESELRELAKTRPDGPLIRNTKGGPWRPETIRKRFERLREKLNLPDDVVPYASRHAFLTRLVETGTPLAVAAKIAGHSRTDTIMSAYLHPEMQAMMSAVDNAAGKVGASVQAETPEDTIARLRAELATLCAAQ